jgi:flagellar basal-body rod modification protein FlgD
VRRLAGELPESPVFAASSALAPLARRLLDRLRTHGPADRLGDARSSGMAVDPVGAAALSQSKTAAGAASGLSQNFDAFLMLLTTQLKNQDPLSPLESTEFVTQLVQFSSVEQAIHQRESLEQLVNLQVAWQATAAVGYIGKTVETTGENLYLKDGKAEIKYKLDEDAGVVKIVIKDMNGDVVNELSGPKGKGDQTITWDGKTKDGKTAADGFYTVSVSATRGAGIAVGATTSFKGVVDAIDSADGQVLLRIGNIRFPIGNVTSVSATPTAPPAGT